jgi:predicted acyl esterase
MKIINSMFDTEKARNKKINLFVPGRRSEIIKLFGLFLILAVALLFVNFNGLNAQDNRTNKNKPINQYKPRIVPNAIMPSAAYTILTSSFNVVLRDGVVLDCSRFYPSAADPNFPHGYPVVIMTHGYGERKEDYATYANDQASYGYVVYTYSMRGQGNSGGLSNLISTVEAQDLIEFVNFIRNDNISRLDSSKILIEGGSQGGILPYMAASIGGLNVKCIISDLATPEEGTTWIENGSIKMTYLWTISYTSDIARYNSLINAMRGWVYANTPEKYDSLAYWMPIGRDFKTQLSQITIPIFLENTWQDMFFNVLGNINAIPFISAPKRYYFGAIGGHGGETSTSENKLINRMWDEWYNYYLLDVHNNLPGRPKYYFAYTQYPLTSSKWSFVHDSSIVWPPPNTMGMKLYFNPGGKLKTTANPADSATTLVNNVTGGLTMHQAVDYAFKGTYFNNRFKKAALVFETDPLTANLKMIGNQLVNLDYSSNVFECQYNFQIYEVSGSTAKLVTRINYTDWHNTPNSRKVKSFYGLSHSHIFKTGNKIRIVVTNLDTSPNDKKFLATNPHVLPSLVNGNHKMFLNSNTYIDLLVKSPGNGMANSFFVKGENKNPNIATPENSTPTVFYLNQNYPNPFNPSTMIQFSIPQNGFVTLTIYDATGKKIATLVNEQKTTGEYSVNFNADTYHLSSGVYFYKLSSGDFSQTRQMLVIK